MHSYLYSKPMYTEDAIRVFGSRAEIAKLLEGLRHRSAIYQWKVGQLIPLGAAVLLARRSEGKLRVNDKLYEQVRRKKILRITRHRARMEQAAARRS